MQHRHLITSTSANGEMSLAAIDDVIERGGRDAWRELGLALRRNPELARKIARICDARLSQDPRSQSFLFWKTYIGERYSSKFECHHSGVDVSSS